MKQRSDAKKQMLLHSQAKVEFYSEYLKRYLIILNNAPNVEKINIFDVFCGEGVYPDGGRGSPIVAFEAIKELKDRKTRIRLIINDKEPVKIAKVREFIESQNEGICLIEYNNMEADTMFGKIYQEVRESERNTRNLIFIDPYGYKAIKKEVLEDLMKNGKTEIILFLPISQMQRFTQKAIKEPLNPVFIPLVNFLNSFFPNSTHPIRKDKIDTLTYIDYITDSLRLGGRYYATSYFIERGKNKHFALFFMGSHIYGFEKILEVKWTLDDEAGRGFTIPETQPSLFAEQVKKASFEKNAKKLEDWLMFALQTPKTNQEVYKIVLQSGFLPKHAVAIFGRWQDQNSDFLVTDIKTGKAAKRKAFYLKEREDKVYLQWRNHENNQN